MSGLSHWLVRSRFLLSVSQWICSFFFTNVSISCFYVWLCYLFKTLKIHLEIVWLWNICGETPTAAQSKIFNTSPYKTLEIPQSHISFLWYSISQSTMPKSHVLQLIVVRVSSVSDCSELFIVSFIFTIIPGGRFCSCIPF